MEEHPIDEATALRQLAAATRRLSVELHAMKGALAANIALMRETLDRQRQLHARQAVHEERLGSIAAATAEMSGLFEAGKKGAGFFQGLGRLLFRIASWLRPILIAGGIVWGLVHGQWPKGDE